MTITVCIFEAKSYISIYSLYQDALENTIYNHKYNLGNDYYLNPQIRLKPYFEQFEENIDYNNKLILYAVDEDGRQYRYINNGLIELI